MSMRLKNGKLAETSTLFLTCVDHRSVLNKNSFLNETFIEIEAGTNAFLIQRVAERILKKEIAKTQVSNLKQAVKDEIIEALKNLNFKLSISGIDPFFCDTQTGAQVLKVNIKPTTSSRAFLHVQEIVIDRIAYVLLDIPKDVIRIQWDVEHQDFYPHTYRSSLKAYDDIEKTTVHLLFSSELKTVDIENLEILGKQSELRNTSFGKKSIAISDLTGIFDEEISLKDRLMNLEIEEGREILWLIEKQ